MSLDDRAEIPQMQPDLHEDQLQAVGKAFDALLLTLYRLTHRHNDLKQYTHEAFKQVLIPLLPPADRCEHSLLPGTFAPPMSQMMREFD